MNKISKFQNRLKAAILHMDLRPGEFLSFADLTDFLDEPTPLSAMTLRQLESSGLLICRADGCLVAPLDIHDIRALCSQRVTIECEAVRLATRRASAADHARIAALADAGEHDQNDPDLSVQSGGAFHAALAEISGNSTLIAMQADLSRRLYRVRWLIFSSPAGRRLGWQEHRHIAALMASCDYDRSVDAMRQHLGRTHDQLLDTLSSLYAEPDEV